MEQLTTGGGVAGLIVATVYVGRLTLDWLKERKHGPTSATSAHVGNAAAANAVLVTSLEALQAENGRLVARVRHLEDEAERYEAKIAELEGRLADIAQELAELRNGKGVRR